jgi:tetratricopeptide (TPR) repeat protein
VAVSHAELELAEYGQSIARILARAHELGIDIIVDKKMVTITDLESLGNRQLALDDAPRHLQDAHEYAEKSFRLAEELKVRPRRAEALILQARVDIADANWPRAETRFREALMIFEELNQPLELAKAYSYYAEGLDAMGEEKGAEEYHRKAKALFDKIGAKGWAKKTAV